MSDETTSPGLKSMGPVTVTGRYVDFALPEAVRLLAPAQAGHLCVTCGQPAVTWSADCEEMTGQPGQYLPLTPVVYHCGDHER